VPLNQHVLFGSELLDLFEEVQSSVRVNPELAQKHAQKLRQPTNRPIRGRRGYPGQPRNQGLIPKLSKPEMVELLDENEMLPAIFFIFSRAGCEAAVKACQHSSVRLTTTEEKQEIRRVVEEKCYNIADED
jgi:ATP-dependent RNA helicase HelY